MDLVRWNPWHELFDTHDRTNFWSDEFFSPTGASCEALKRNLNWNPVVDIYENEDRFVVQAELPGIDKQDIALDVKGRILTLKGERRVDEEANDKNMHRRERFYGRFERSFQLPKHVDTEKITADYKDGVLKIEIPKPEAAKPKQITVH